MTCPGCGRRDGTHDVDCDFAAQQGGYPSPWPPLEIPSTPGPLSGDMYFPGRGYLPRPGEDRPALSAWGRLSRGGAMGKKTNLVYAGNSSQAQTRARVTILEIRGDDADAQQLVVTLGPPSVVPRPFSQTLAQANPENLTGEQDSEQIQSRGVFPGTLLPVRWPQFEAIVEWGVGGASYRAVVDYLDGATINLVASWLRVFGAVASRPSSDLVGTSAVYTLSAFVGPGWTPTTAQNTVGVGSVDSLAESGVFAVPRFARTACAVGCDPSATPNVTVATLRFWQSPDGVAGGNCVGNFVSTGAQPLGFPIPAGAAYFSVVNGMSVPSDMSVVFGLAI